jgi:fibronectin-binding autotransporter adhesin
MVWPMTLTRLSCSHPLFAVSVASTALLSLSQFSQAADFTWNGSVSNDWSDGGNWDGGSIPSGNELRVNIGVSGKPITWEKRAIFSSGELILSGGSNYRGLFLGNGVAGNMEISGGTITNNATGGDGMSNGGGTSKLLISGGTYNSDQSFYLTFGPGNSVLQITSGLFNVKTLNLQSSAGGDVTAAHGGTLQLDGGTLRIEKIERSAAASIHNINLNGGTIASRSGATWADLTNTTWTIQSKSTFDIGHSVTLQEALGGAGGFDKIGAGTFTLSGDSTYTGVTTITGMNSAITVAHNNALGAGGTGNHTVVGNTARLNLGDGVAVSNESLTITGAGGDGSFGALRAARDSTATWNGSITTTGSEARIGAYLGGNLIVNGDINANDRNLIIRTEGGATTPENQFANTSVTLGGTYTGTSLTLYQGLLKLGASDRISDSTHLILGTTVTNDLRQHFDLNGYDETLAGISVSSNAASDTHVVTNSSTTLSTLTLNSTTSRTYSGLVTGNLAITKTGSNTVTFSGVNTYTGDTSVKQGTFTVSTAGALNGGGSTMVTSGATFTLLGAYLFNIGENGVSNQISGAGTVNLTGTLNIDLSLAARGEGNAWQLVNTTGSTNWNGVRITSGDQDFVANAGTWTLDQNGETWSFNQTTGILTLVAIPEPSQTALLVSGLASLVLLRRRD